MGSIKNVNIVICYLHKTENVLEKSRLETVANKVEKTGEFSKFSSGSCKMITEHDQVCGDVWNSAFWILTQKGERGKKEK